MRFDLARGANAPQMIERLDEAGLHVVSIDANRQAIVAFRENQDLAEFERAIVAFAAGPTDGHKSNKWDILAYIEPTSVRRWSRADRIGPRLRNASDVVRFEPEQWFKLDVELWHPGSVEAARRSLDKIRQLRDATPAVGRGPVLDSYVGRTICLARVRLLGRVVDDLLELPEVAGVDLPPQSGVELGVSSASLNRIFPTPAKPPDDGPRLCILDSGVTSAHPLLGPFVGDATSVHSSITSAADLHGHGTGVAGVAVFGDLRDRVAHEEFSSSITLYSVRMLDDAARLDEDRLVVNQIREAVERYRATPYSCRVFNLAFGEERTFLAKTGGRQGLWAEVLDLIAAELDVVFIVSAGNVPVKTTNADEAEALLTSLGRHLAQPAHRLVDPATAAIAVTVGAVAMRAETTVPPVPRADDIRRPVAPNVGDPSPFTRVGPGVAGALKPEFVDDGGNLVWSGYGGQQRTIGEDSASAVLLLSNEHRRSSGWFRYDVGTSFAAPRVARIASMLEHDLKQRLQRPPTANLIRALLGAGAEPTRDVDEQCGRSTTVTFMGYGRVDEDFALWSSDRRVVLYHEDEIELDHFAMFELPVPDEFMQIRGRKDVTISVAYDPPVRARREEYLGVSLDFDLFRGADPGLLFEHFRRRRSKEPEPPGIQAHRFPLTPGSGTNRDFGWSRSKSTLQVGRGSFQHNTRPNRWWLVVRVRRRWAPREYTSQRFALAAVLQASYGDIYARVQARLRARDRARARR